MSKGKKIDNIVMKTFETTIEKNWLSHKIVNRTFQFYTHGVFKVSFSLIFIKY